MYKLCSTTFEPEQIGVRMQQIQFLFFWWPLNKYIIVTQTLHMFHIYKIKVKLKRLILILITVETIKQHLLFQVIQNIYANLILY